MAMSFLPIRTCGLLRTAMIPWKEHLIFGLLGNYCMAKFQFRSHNVHDIMEGLGKLAEVIYGTVAPVTDYVGRVWLSPSESP